MKDDKNKMKQYINQYGLSIFSKDLGTYDKQALLDKISKVLSARSQLREHNVQFNIRIKVEDDNEKRKNRYG